MSFIIDLLNGSDVPSGDGPLVNALSVSVGESLDEAGQIQFSLPATDYRAATLIDQAAKFRVRLHDDRGLEDDRFIYGLIGGDTIDAASEQPTRQIQGFDLFAELGNKAVGWWCFYEASDLNTVILPELLTDTRWSLGTIEAGLGNYTQRFDGDSRLAALIKLTQQLGKHFRMGSTLRTLDFGAFGSVSPIRLTNVQHALRAQDANLAIAIIGSLQLTSDRAAVVHRIYPWGAGEDGGNTDRNKVSLWYLPHVGMFGADVTDARWAEIGITPGVRGSSSAITSVHDSGDTLNNLYDVVDTTGFISQNPGTAVPYQQLAWVHDPDDLTQSLAFNFVTETVFDSTHLEVRGSPDLPPRAAAGDILIGNPQLYLQTADYDPGDPREAVVIFNDVKTISSNASHLAAVAPQLFMRAQRYLATHAVPQRTYQISVLRAPYTLRVGDKVRVIYRGAVTRNGVTVNWIDLDEELYLIKITRTFNADGSTAATLAVSNIDAQPLDDVSALADNSGQVGAIAVNAS